MTFQIDFNSNTDVNKTDENLEKLGATHREFEDGYDWYEIDINTVQEMNDLYVKINSLFGDSEFDYSLLVNFHESPSIYIDNKS